MAKIHTKVIVNPAAGANSTYRRWQRLNQLLRNTGLSFDFEYTEGAGHATEIAKLAASDGYQSIVAVGGDGTVNEVANGILRSTNASTSLGILSTGTGADFMRSIAPSMDYASACASFCNPKKKLVDVGIVEFQLKGKKTQRYFVNVAGVGFDGEVVERTEKGSKLLGGRMTYLSALLRTLIRYRNKNVDIKTDKGTISDRVISIIVANGAWVGGGMHVAPNAKLDDGSLDLLVIGNMGKFELLRSLNMVYKGTHIHHPKVKSDKVTTVNIQSKERLLVHADGELLGECPATFSLLPSALSIIV